VGRNRLGWLQASGGKRTRRESWRASGGLRALGRGKQGWEAGFLYSFFLFSNSNKTSNQVLNSNQGLNPNTQKQCTSMNATVNSYISLIN
jgi:hypothetical protein